MISVCIATYNGEKYIKEELTSILPQLSPEDEVIISDDGSTDNTVHVINSLNDPRIKVVIHNHETRSPNLHTLVTRNFENAISYAKGDVIFLADQDDVWHSDKVQKCLQKLDYYTLVIHNLKCVDFNLNSLSETIFGDKGFRFNNYLFLGEHSYFGCAMAFKRELLDIVLPFPSKLSAHDFWIGLMAETLFSACYIEEPLMDYRIHSSNTSSIDDHSIFYSLSFRLYILWCLSIRCLKYKFRHA